MRWLPIYLVLGGIFAASGANAACTLPVTLQNGTLADADQVMQNFNAVAGCVDTVLPVLDAKQYGVLADGSTSDDLALKAAASACAATGGATLVLPTGNIRLTGAAQITLNHCKLLGQGVAPSGGTIRGTTIQLTSTSVVPFILGDGGIGIEGVNFYWPGQVDGTTVFPALFTDTSAGVASMYWDHVNILNAYNGFVPSGSSGGIGRWYIANSNLYAVHDLFQVGTVGDYMYFSNVAFNYGSWVDGLGFTTAVKNAINAADATNTMFHLIAPTTSAGAVISIANSSAFAWGNAFKLDATAHWDFGNVNMALDGVKINIDSTSGGAINNVVFTCSACIAGTANVVTGNPATGNTTAFKLGTTGTLRLNNSVYNSAVGSLVESAGSDVFLTNNHVVFGSANDGTDYYAVKITGGSGSAHVDMRDNFLVGVNTSTKHHGFKTTVGLGGFSLTNNRSIYLNDILDATLSSGVQQFIGNASESTAGTSAIITSGTGSLTYSGNTIDRPPQPAVSSCGTGASILYGGPTNGAIQVGSTNPTTTCNLAMPFTPTNVVCTFGSSAAVAIAGSPSGTPPSWGITTSADVHDGQIFYSCPASQ